MRRRQQAAGLRDVAATERQGYHNLLHSSALGFGRPHKAHDPSLWRPTYHRAPGRVVGTLQDPFGRYDEPSFADQRLVAVALDAVFGSAAIRNRAARDAGA